MQDPTRNRLIHGGHKGTEAEFGSCAERWGVPETTISFEGHDLSRGVDVDVLTDGELASGDVSMEIVFARLGRRFARGKGIRRVIQSMFHIVNRGDHLFAIGWIQEDGTVKGGTGWGVELAKFFNRGIHVFDQDKEKWYRFTGSDWQEDDPTIPENKAFSATGTRNLTPAGRAAIEALFVSTYGPR